MDKTTIRVGGMTCVVCAKTVEKNIRKLTGVENVSVNFATEKATVSYDPEKVRLSAILKAVEQAGYKALESEEGKKSLWVKFIVAACFSLPLLIITMVPGIIKAPATTYTLIQLFLTVPVVCAGYKFYTVGYKSLWKRSPNMDSLIAIGTTAAVLYGYFETACVILTFTLLGKTLEAVSKGKANEAIRKLMELAPKTALIIRGGEEKEIPISEVEAGDIVIIKPGAKIPVDGTVMEGLTSIDESMLTGESMPIDKKAGDPVYAATINTTGTIKFKAGKVGSETILAQIIRMVEDAQGSKAPIARMADIVSSYFVPAVCAVAILSGSLWYFGSGGDIKFALMIFISVLVIACPCALGLATPIAVMVGTGIGAENGIFIKSGEALEKTHKINMAVFDKTGTITEGKPKVTDVRTIDFKSPEILLQLVASSEKSSEHPLGQAIVAEAREKGLEFLPAESFTSITGYGIKAVIGEHEVLAGNRKLMDEKNIPLAEANYDSETLANEGKTLVYIAVGGKLAGIIAIADVIKTNSKTAVENLRKMGIETVMISGDNRKTAENIAKQAGISRVLAEVLPDEKANEIKRMQADGYKVAMVGDGINDAPALSQADVGIAIGSGTDIAMESADIVLMRSDLTDVPAAVKLSKRTVRIIKQNLFWAFGYNIAGIPVAAGALHLFGGPLLHPMLAAAAMSLSSIFVVTNALRQKLY